MGKNHKRVELAEDNVAVLIDYENTGLDSVQYLLFRAERDESDWSRFSLKMAIRGMEEEDSPYTVNDLRETYL